MTSEERKAAVEAIIYAADEPATVEQLANALGEEKLVVQAALDELVAKYSVEEHGIEIRGVAGGYKMYTKPQQHDVVRRFIKALRPPLRLTMPALETLAVIAYKQPVTAPEISEIRGVNAAGVISTLLDKRLITTAGRKEVIGRPILYRTSKEFLMRFGLSDLEELPSLKEFEALAREALGGDEGIVASAGEVASEEWRVASEESAKRAVDGEAKATEEKELVAEEVAATNEGMPAGETDEEAKTATAGE
jgi:segregation and condensation protein B